jgi:hypothetical protein
LRSKSRTLKPSHVMQPKCKLLEDAFNSRFLVDVQPDEPVNVSNVDDDLAMSRQNRETAARRFDARPIVFSLT